MNRYKISPKYKKSLTEVMRYVNEDNTKVITHSILWRWGELIVTAESEQDILNKFEDGVLDLEQSGLEYEVCGTTDGCYEDFEFEGLTDDEEEKMTEIGSWDFELHGYEIDTVNFIIESEIDIALEGN